MGDGAVGQHDRHPDEQVAHGAREHTQRPARIGCDEPTDSGARHHFVEREPLARSSDGALDDVQRATGLRADDEIAGLVFEHPVHRRQVEDQVVVAGGGTPCQFRAGTPHRDDRAVLTSGSDCFGYLFGRRRPRDATRRASVEQRRRCALLDIDSTVLQCFSQAHQKISALPS
nr:hypothetical protein [Calidifontibacter indicus]